MGEEEETYHKRTTSLRVDGLALGQRHGPEGSSVIAT